MYTIFLLAAQNLELVPNTSSDPLLPQSTTYVPGQANFYNPYYNPDDSRNQ